MLKRSIFIISTIFLMTAAAFADDPPPQWLANAARQPVPTYRPDIPAVVLYDEEIVSVGQDNKLQTTDNYAVKALSNEGRGFAIAKAYYLVSSGSVKDIKAWLIRSDGSVKYYDKKTILDVISDPDDVYNEGRIKVIDGTADMQSGFTFGYTIVSEDTALFYQDKFSFQGRLPVILSRYSLDLPQGWTAKGTTFNAPEITPQVSGSNYTWEMRALPPIPFEPMGPSTANLSPRIAVNFSPANSSVANRTFNDWVDVSRWGSGLHDPEVVIDDNVAAKARELTAGAKTEFDKIKSIGKYVQNLQYISIDIGVGYGNGFRPRPSNVVLGRGYGDCKDKANLMRAMLKVVGIESYPIAIFSGDPAFVKAQWPSPSQFNHCIIAVKVSAETKSPTIIEHPSLGRLLIFDATDSYTPVGDLPDYLQGSKALIMAGEKGGLAEMPTLPGINNLLERNINATVLPTGELKGNIAEKAVGQTSTVFRRELRTLSQADYKKVLERWLSRSSTGTQLVNFKTKDQHEDASFDLDVEFAAPNYGQLMQDKLLVFKPVIVGRRNSVWFSDAVRTTPIELDANLMKESTTFSLPVGFTVDELPDPVVLRSTFGEYSAACEAKDGKLLCRRSLSMNRIIIPPSDYDKVKDFFAKMREAEQNSVVLIKK